MGVKTLVNSHADTGVSTVLEDTEDGFLLHNRQADVEPILDLNREKRGHGRSYYARDPDMWKVASVPIGIQYEWFTKFGVAMWDPDHMPAVEKLLNSNEYRYLKTADIII